VNALEITPDKRLLAAAGNPHVRLFDCLGSSSQPVTSYSGHTSNVTSLGFQKESKWMYTGSEDGSIKIWDLRAPGCQRDFRGKSPISGVTLHPNQVDLVSVDEDGNLRVWDLKATTCGVDIIPDGKIPLRSVTVATDASVVVAANNRGGCFVWKFTGSRASELELLHKFDAHPTYILKCVLSPDGKTLATTSADKTISLWNVEKNFELERTLTGHQAWVWDCAFSADSAYLVSASSDRTGKLWDLKTGDIIVDYKGHTKALTAIALNDS